MRAILKKHWDVLTNTPGLAKIVGPAPLMVAKRAKNLGDILVHSEFTRTVDSNWLSNYPRSKGTAKFARMWIEQIPFMTPRTNIVIRLKTLLTVLQLELSTF